MVKVLIKKLDPSVKLPEYKTIGASGMDLIAFIREPLELKPQMSCICLLYTSDAADES